MGSVNWKRGLSRVGALYAAVAVAGVGVVAGVDMMDRRGRCAAPVIVAEPVKVAARPYMGLKPGDAWLANQPTTPAPPLPDVTPQQARQAVAVTPPGEPVTFEEALVEARALAARRAEEDKRRRAAADTARWRAMHPETQAPEPGAVSECFWARPVSLLTAAALLVAIGLPLATLFTWLLVLGVVRLGRWTQRGFAND